MNPDVSPSEPLHNLHENLQPEQIRPNNWTASAGRLVKHLLMGYGSCYETMHQDPFPGLWLARNEGMDP